MDALPRKWPMAPKVKWAAVGSYLAGVAVVTFLAILRDPSLVEGVPDWLIALLAPLLPGGAAAGAGYNAEHQYRGSDVSPSDDLQPRVTDS